MTRSIHPHPFRVAKRSSLSVLLLCLASVGVTHAQVKLDVRDGQVVILNSGFAPQELTRVTGKTGSAGWFVGDNVGNFYEAKGDSTGTGGNQTGGSGGTTTPPVIIVGGYEAEGDSTGTGGNQTGGSGGTTTPPVIIVGGYESALQHLQQRFGVVIERDQTLGVDVIQLPSMESVDPFFEALMHDSLNGYPLYQYFRLLEVVSRGSFDEPVYTLAKTALPPLPFPNDPLYWEQWGLRKSRIALAQWLSALAHQRVRIAVIDSGVGPGEQAGPGLDGAQIEHVTVAPTTGRPAVHGLGLLSLLADRSHDGDGIVGMVGNWGDEGCYANAPLFQNTTPQLVSYNVGDFGPISIYVARAIRLAVEAGVDVINLSMRMGYSPLVESAIEEALRANVIVVAAAGNYAAGASNKPTAFPANIEGVIAVGAATESLAYAPFSAREGVDILAPGERVVIGGPGGIWYYGSGTSYAAPYVTATVAMMRAVNPGLTPAEIVQILQSRARDRNRSDVGFLNALSSVNAVLGQADRIRYLMLPHECVLRGGLGKDGAYTWTETDDYDDAQDDDLFAHEAEQAETPATTALEGAQPNPFAHHTTVTVALAEAQMVRVHVYNTLGQRVRVLADGVLAAGRHPLVLDASELPAGLYFVRLETSEGVEMQAVTLVR